MKRAGIPSKIPTDTVRRLLLNPDVRVLIVALVYLLMISLAEYLTTAVDPLVGVVFHGMILAALLIHGSILHRQIHRRFFILLSLAPLIRLLSLSIPLNKLGLPMIYWYMIIGILLFVAAFIAGRITQLRGRRIGWSWKTWPLQMLIGLSGFALGYVEFQILKPGPLAAYMTWVDILTAALILLIFTGVLEEYIFRGLLQSASMQIMGTFGLYYIAILFAVLHFGYHSLIDVIFVLLVGLLFGFCVWKTHSLIGASLAHGIANISLYVFFPLVLTTGSLPVAASEAETAQRETPIQFTMDEIEATMAAGTSLPPGDAVVDDGDRGLVYTGKNLWVDDTGGFGGHFLWTYVTQSVPEVVVTWLPALQGCGVYRVEAFVPAGPGLTDAARYIVNHRQGTTTVDVSQAAYSGAWAPLGIFEFEVGVPANVRLSNFTGEDPRLLRWIGFDAIRWLLIRSCSVSTETPGR